MRLGETLGKFLDDTKLGEGGKRVRQHLSEIDNEDEANSLADILDHIKETVSGGTKPKGK